MIDKQKLFNDLTDAFINYQHRLEFPMPSPTETPEALQLRYMQDVIFHNRVKSLVSGVMHIVDKHVS